MSHGSRQPPLPPPACLPPPALTATALCHPPCPPAAWYRLGTAYLGLGGSNAEAQAAFSRGLQLKPHNKQLQEGLARCTAAAGGSGPQAAGAGSAENQAPPAAAADAKAYALKKSTEI